MKQVEKLAYIEARLMQFFWEDSEIKRHIDTALQDWSSSEQKFEVQLSHLRKSWESAKDRVGDVPPDQRDRKWNELVEAGIELELTNCMAWHKSLRSKTESSEVRTQLQELAAHRLHVVNLGSKVLKGQVGQGDHSAGGEASDRVEPEKEKENLAA